LYLREREFEDKAHFLGKCKELSLEKEERLFDFFALSSKNLLHIVTEGEEMIAISDWSGLETIE
jgi:hypothetical protein